MDLSHIKIPDAKLNCGLFHRTDFSNADLTNVNFENSVLVETNFHQVKTKTLKLGVGETLQEIKNSKRAAFIKGNKQIISLDKDYNLNILTLPTNNNICQTKILSYAYLPKSDCILAADDKHNVHWIPIHKKGSLNSKKAHEKQIYCISSTKDERYFFTASLDKTIKMWSTSKELEIICTLRNSEYAYDSVSVSACNRYICAGTPTQVILLKSPLPVSSNTKWDFKTSFIKKLKECTENGNYVIISNFSDDGKMILIGTTFGRLELWDTNTHKIINSTAIHPKIRSVNFSPDSSFFVTCHSNGDAKIYCTSDLGFIKKIVNGITYLSSAAFTSDSQQLLLSRDFGESRLYKLDLEDYKGGKYVQTTSTKNLILEPNEKFYITASNLEGGIVFRETLTGKFIKQIPVNKDWLQTNFEIQISPDGSKLIGVFQKLIAVWDVETAKLLSSVIVKYEISNIKIFPKGNAILGGIGNQVHFVVVDAKTGKIKKKLRTVDGGTKLDFSPSGVVFGGIQYQRLHLSNPRTMRRMKRFELKNLTKMLGANYKFECFQDNSQICMSANPEQCELLDIHKKKVKPLDDYQSEEYFTRNGTLIQREYFKQNVFKGDFQPEKAYLTKEKNFIIASFDKKYLKGFKKIDGRWVLQYNLCSTPIGEGFKSSLMIEDKLGKFF